MCSSVSEMLQKAHNSSPYRLQRTQKSGAWDTRSDYRGTLAGLWLIVYIDLFFVSPVKCAIVFPILSSCKRNGHIQIFPQDFSPNSRRPYSPT